MIKEGTVFKWGNNLKAVVVRVLDEDRGNYYCVYHQDKRKYVVAEFSFSNGGWHISDDSGREVNRGEWPRYIDKLKNEA